MADHHPHARPALYRRPARQADRVHQAAFAAAKTVAWLDRAAPRDLFDLWLLAQDDGLDGDAAQLFARHGPTNKPPTADMFTTAPGETRWRRELSAQTRLRITAGDALRVVRQAWVRQSQQAP